MRIDILTIFPDIFSPLKVSVVGRAQESGLFSLHIHDIRDYALDEHKSVDDRPYGGGPGMVMKAEPIVRAVEDVKQAAGSAPRIIVMSPRGGRFCQRTAENLLGCGNLIIICGRYEGIDERVLEILGAEELSIGDYILCGGEIPAMAVVEAVARLIPGVLGDEESIKEESFSNSLLEYPHYTRPETFRGKKTPGVLLSGDHKKIRQWRKQQALERTRKKRPDLFFQENI